MTLSVRVDNKGRLTIPKEMRETLDVKPGDIFFLRCEKNLLCYAKAENPFDVLAEHAIQEYNEGKTKRIEELVEEWGMPKV